MLTNGIEAIVDFVFILSPFLNGCMLCCLVFSKMIAFTGITFHLVSSESVSEMDLCPSKLSSKSSSFIPSSWLSCIIVANANSRSQLYFTLSTFFSKSYHPISPVYWINFLFSDYVRQHFYQVFHYYMSHYLPAFCFSWYVAQLYKHISNLFSCHVYYHPAAKEITWPRPKSTQWEV